MNNNENFNVLNPLGAWNSTRLYRAQVIYTQAVSLPAYISCPFVTYGGSLYYSTGFDVNDNQLQPTQGLVPSQDPAWLLVNITGGGGGLPTITSPTGTILVTGTLQNPNIDLPQSVAQAATPTFAGLNISYTTQERSILKKMLSLFTTDDVQAVFNASIRTGVLTANRVVTIPDGDSVTVIPRTATANQVVAYIGADGIQRLVPNSGGGGGINVNKGDGSGTNVVPNATTLNFAGVGYSVIPDLNIPNQANVIANPTNNANFSYIYSSAIDTFPYTFTFTDLTQPVPTGWTWTISGNGVVPATDYDFINGTSATSQNPQIIFYNAKLYNVTLTPTNTDRSIRYTALSAIVPPNPSSFYTGDFNINCSLGINVVNKLWTNYSATDVITIVVGLNDTDRPVTQVDNTSTLIIASGGSPVPTFTVSVNDINNQTTLTSTPIPQPTTFPVNYFAQIGATITNVDTSLSDTVNNSNRVSYYTPAFYIQNQSLTAPTFNPTASQVANNNYFAGQNILFANGSDIQVIWVAFPILPPPFFPPLPPLPQAFVVYKGEYNGTADILSSTATQTIVGQVYKIFGYQIGYTGYSIYSGNLFLESLIPPPPIPQDRKKPILQKQPTATPKLGFFQRLFGAKS